MSHYFDEILHRQVGGAQTPKSPMLSPRLHRSSTSRSLAARSDYSVNGTGGDSGAATPPATGTAGGGVNVGGGGTNGYHQQGGAPPPPARRGSVNPTMLSDPDRVRARAEADRHLHSYITQQLERVRLERGDEAGYVEGDELETQP